MKIVIIGTGYVGLTTGVGFSHRGHDVICIDVIQEKVDKINSGISPIYEPEIEDHLKEGLAKGNFKATTDWSLVDKADVFFISVGTPSNDDGSMDIGYIKQAARDIGNYLKTADYSVVVVKSTVVPETTEKEVLPILEETSGKKVGQDFGLCMTPEFLREGTAMKDFLEPDRTVVGEYDKRSGDVLESIFRDFNGPILRTQIRVAEMIKYANNAFLATKISFSNEIGNMCKKLGIDVYDVFKGVGMDNRISSKFFGSGVGWGGSCFPKDVAALVHKSRTLGVEPKILDAATQTNTEQKTKLVRQLEEKIGDLKDKKIALLGISFKPDTDDIREAPSINIIKDLKRIGANIIAYDPQAMNNIKNIFPDIEYADNAKGALSQADAALIITDWEEFKNLKNEDFDVMKSRVILEGRKTLNREEIKDFDGICW
ncbi:MAG: UDP-glucose/GDP-mannose dehydrogenase family protein [Candidatus Aenigmatarchaeota archaeon]